MIYNIKEISGKYKTQGRTSIVNDLLMIDHSISGIEFNAECCGKVSVTFKALDFMSYRDNEKRYAGFDSGCYFSVIVDGEKQPSDCCGIFEIGEVTVTLAENLSQGVHRFEIYRNNELIKATVGIKSISLEGTLCDAPQNNGLYIEFIGDSITAAFGNLAFNQDVTIEEAHKSIFQDATLGYAYLTATALGADFSSIARSGIGASVGWTDYTMQDFYPKLRYTKDNTVDYDFVRQPDIVVLALGTNDVDTYLNHNMALNDVKQGFKEMLSLVKSKNPEAKVVWIYDMMRDEANALVTEVMEEAGGEEKGFYSLKVGRNNEGGHTHPHYTGHQEFAKNLTAFIRSKML